MADIAEIKSAVNSLNSSSAGAGIQMAANKTYDVRNIVWEPIMPQGYYEEDMGEMTIRNNVAGMTALTFESGSTLNVEIAVKQHTQYNSGWFKDVVRVRVRIR